MIANDPPELVATQSSVVYRNRWMAVREDRTRRRDGRSGIYGVVDKPDFALIVPYARGGFHLVEQFRYPVQGRYWEFPQGSWEHEPEADPLVLARAELAEETGLRAGRMIRLGHLFTAYGYSSQGLHVFVALDLSQGPTSLEDEEVGLTSRWHSEADVWRLIAEGRFKDSPSVAALALFERYRRTDGNAGCRPQ